MRLKSHAEIENASHRINIAFSISTLDSNQASHKKSLRATINSEFTLDSVNSLLIKCSQTLLCGFFLEKTVIHMALRYYVFVLERVIVTAVGSFASEDLSA